MYLFFILSTAGKLKTKTGEKLNSSKDVSEDDKATGAIDQIKKKYGYAVNNVSHISKHLDQKREVAYVEL